MNQRKYAMELLTDTSLLTYKPALTPIDNHAKLSSTRSVHFTYARVNIRLIRRLMYLTNTQLDITFFVQQLSLFLAKPTISHYSATILRYIRGASSLGLFFLPTLI